MAPTFSNWTELHRYADDYAHQAQQHQRTYDELPDYVSTKTHSIAQVSITMNIDLDETSEYYVYVWSKRTNQMNEQSQQSPL